MVGSAHNSCKHSALQLLYFSISDFKASSLFAEVKLRMLVDRIKCFDIGFPVLSMRCCCNNPHHPRPWAWLVHPSERSCTPLFLSNFTNKSFLYLNFLKQFFSEDSNPCVLITRAREIRSWITVHLNLTANFAAGLPGSEVMPDCCIQRGWKYRVIWLMNAFHGLYWSR